MVRGVTSGLTVLPGSFIRLGGGALGETSDGPPAAGEAARGGQPNTTGTTHHNSNPIAKFEVHQRPQFMKVIDSCKTVAMETHTK